MRRANSKGADKQIEYLIFANILLRLNRRSIIIHKPRRLEVIHHSIKYHNDWFGDLWREKPVIPTSRRIFRQAVFGTENSELLFK